MQIIKLPSYITLSYKSLGIIALLLLLSNFGYLFVFVKNSGIFEGAKNIGNNESKAASKNKLLDISSATLNTNKSSLYLMEQAERYISDIAAFENAILKTSKKLDIAPEWLMAVIHCESKFDATVVNFKGSGAVGLIQFKPYYLSEMKISPQKLKNLNPIQQMDFVLTYFKNQKELSKYKSFESLTDLYLAALAPEVVGEDFCTSLFVEPSPEYTFHEGLDENKDGRVTVQDVDKYLKRVYPTAYMIPKPNYSWFSKLF